MCVKKATNWDKICGKHAGYKMITINYSGVFKNEGKNTNKYIDR